MNCEHRPWHGICYECIQLRQENEALVDEKIEMVEEISELRAFNNRMLERVEELEEDNNAHMHDVHTLAMRELETMEALEAALERPNLLRLVVQGIIFEYKGA